MHPEQNVKGTSPRLADQHLWSSPDNMASEAEVGDFMYGLVRLLKPKLVVETGTYHGHTSEKILYALRDNEFGRFIGCEPDPDRSLRTIQRLDLKFGHSIYQIFQGKSFNIKAQIGECDLLFSDSTGPQRPEEYSWLKPGAICVVHDVHSHADVGAFVNKLNGLVIDSPRGLGILRK